MPDPPPPRLLSASARLCGFLLLLASPALAGTLETEFGPAGEIKQLRVDGQAFATGIGLRLVKAGWSGSFADQAAGSGVIVQRGSSAGKLTFTGTIGEGINARFTQTIAQAPDGITVTYRIEPTVDSKEELENISLWVLLPCGPHAGQTRWLLDAGSGPAEGLLPATLPGNYMLLSAGSPNCIALGRPGATALQVACVSGVGWLQMQDERKFSIDRFALFFPVRERGKLLASAPVEFSVSFRAVPFAQVETSFRQLKAALAPPTIPLTSRKPLELRDIRMDPPHPLVYNKLELSLDLDATFDNPFDPDDIRVDAQFRSPDDRVLVAPGFYFQDFERSLQGNSERLKPVGAPGWKVRFAPDREGWWACRVEVTDRSGTVHSSWELFHAGRPWRKGFVRTSPDSRRYFAFDNGEGYFPIGENVGWPSGRGTYDYDRWFADLSSAGGNFARFWSTFFCFGLEWTDGSVQPAGRGSYPGLGRYSLDNAWRLDYLVELAARENIYLMFCLGYHGELQEAADIFGSNVWPGNPYNAKNGGPCATPVDFWTHPLARKLYRQRLRYTIARYSYATSIQSWELWNEVDAPACWTDEMASYLRANDPARHLVTTTWGSDPVWRLASIDFTQLHRYGADDNQHDIAAMLLPESREQMRKYPKPHLIGEFGIDYKASNLKYDPDGNGVGLHNGIWAGAMSGTAGSAMSWWWDNYIAPKNLYDVFTPLAEFARRVPWTSGGFREPDVSRPICPDRLLAYTDVSFACTGGWGKASRTSFTVDAEGTLHEPPFPSYLYSPGKADIRTTPELNVKFPVDGNLILHLGTVSNWGLLRVTIDGEVAHEEVFDTGPGEGPWKTASFRPQYNLYQNVYDCDIVVPVAAGKHSIVLENVDGDWMTLDNITLSPYASNRLAELRIVGRQGPRLTVLWIQNLSSTWYTFYQKRQPQPVEGAQFDLRGMKPGLYSIEWWNTWQGGLDKVVRQRADRGTLGIHVPPVERDRACVVRWIGR